MEEEELTESMQAFGYIDLVRQLASCKGSKVTKLELNGRDPRYHADKASKRFSLFVKASLDWLLQYNFLAEGHNAEKEKIVKTAIYTLLCSAPLLVTLTLDYFHGINLNESELEYFPNIFRHLTNLTLNFHVGQHTALDPRDLGFEVMRRAPRLRMLKLKSYWYGSRQLCRTEFIPCNFHILPQILRPLAGSGVVVHIGGKQDSGMSLNYYDFATLAELADLDIRFETFWIGIVQTRDPEACRQFYRALSHFLATQANSLRELCILKDIFKAIPDVDFALPQLPYLNSSSSYFQQYLQHCS